MKLIDAKREFDIRYYRWAQSEFRREIDENYPTLIKFKSGSAWKIHQFMVKLDKIDQITLSHALLKRFHANAVNALSESISPEEESLLNKREAFLPLPPEWNTLDYDSSAIRFASKRVLRKLVTEKLTKVFGAIQVDDEPEAAFQTRSNGWVINTFFSFGRRETSMRYTHNIVSEDSFPVGAGRMFMAMGGVISFNSWMGIASQTEWPHLLEEDTQTACDTVFGLCARFFDALPSLLAGLACEIVTPEGPPFTSV